MVTVGLVVPMGGMGLVVVMGQEPGPVVPDWARPTGVPGIIGARIRRVVVSSIRSTAPYGRNNNRSIRGWASIKGFSASD